MGHDARMNEPTWTDIVGALATVGAAAFAFVAVIFAAVAWGTAKKTLVAAERTAEQAEQTVVQMREDSQALREDSALATRPYLSARLVPTLWADNGAELLIENYGRSAAYDFTMGIETSDAPDDDFVREARKFAESKVVMPPGARTRVLWYMPARPAEGISEELGFESATIALRYTGSSGEAYEDPPIRLDVDTLRAGSLASSGPRATTGDDKLGQDRNHALRTIAQHLGELRR